MLEGATGFFKTRALRNWLLILSFCFYLAVSWVLYSITVDPMYGMMSPPTIGADSGTYFQMAGLSEAANNSAVDQSSLVNLGGSSLGPVAVALVFRTTFGVACFNVALLLLTIWWAGLIPGVSRELFAFLVAIDLQTIPTLMTLNKEVLAIAGMVAFCVYVYKRRDGSSRLVSRTFLMMAVVLSILARWEQIAILFWYIALQWRRSPLRMRPRTAVVALLLCCSLGYAAAVHVLHVNLEGFVKQAEGGGTISLLYKIQERGGYFLVAAPKILMNMLGQPGYSAWILPSRRLLD